MVTAGTLRVGRSNVGMINDKGRSAVFQCSSAAVSLSLGAAMLFSVHAMEAPLTISLPHGNILMIDKLDVDLIRTLGDFEGYQLRLDYRPNGCGMTVE